jgi:hypothetical protein
MPTQDCALEARYMNVPTDHEDTES